VTAKCIACVDDDADVLKVRRLLLEASGYSVFTATSGAELLRFLTDAGEVDVVLLDYLMPEMNGDQLAHKLHQQYPQLPLIAVSAVPQLPDSMLGLVDATVQKGSDPELLLSTVAAILAQPQKKHPQIRSPKTTVLCVDDEDLQLNMRKRLFEAAGYKVLEARSAQEALEIFRSTHVDAVVMDYWLSGSGRNGTALAEQIKRDRPTTPILMLSGLGPLPGESAIVDLWLSKGHIEPQQLVAEVQRLIELRTPQQKDSRSER
jgi:CheY-like chemotaxis protein